MTFDGKKKVQGKCTYRRIQEYLQLKYKSKIYYSTTIQLYVPRNLRSAKNYRSLAQVTSRRARKGFEYGYNPDSHWSCAFYKGLDFLQYMDGTDLMILNRDDLAVFRCDTM